MICLVHGISSAALNILVYTPSSLFSDVLVRVQLSAPYINTLSTVARKKAGWSIYTRYIIQ